jgi:hypothetical protein
MSKYRRRTRQTVKCQRGMSALLFALLFVACAHAQIVGGMWSRSSLSLVPIKGSPFSADVIDENDQILSDGNRIHHETHGKMFRDSEGRTRTETEIRVPGGEQRLVTILIMDPVKQINIEINPQTKTVTIHHMEQRAQQAIRAVEPRPAKSGATVNPVIPGGPTPGIPATPAPGAEEAIRRLLQGEDLGTKSIEGFLTQGSRRTFTTPAGQMGNEKPMVSKTDTWFSPDLQEVLLIKSENPMSGQYTKKLLNIQVSEPDPALFQPPADYTIKDIAAQQD